MWTTLLTASLALAGLPETPAPADLPTDGPVATAADQAASALLLRSFKREIDRGDMAVVLHPEGAFLQFTEPIEFVTNEARKTPSQDRELDRIAEVLAEHPDVDVQLLGHADRRDIESGPYDTNEELSLARAKLVMQALVERGISADRLHPSAQSDTDPQAVNAAIARTLNRRVEIRITPAIDVDAVEVGGTGFGRASFDGVASL